MISWTDLRSVIEHMHALINGPTGIDSGHDYSYIGIENKSELNRLSPEYYKAWRRALEPKFFVIKQFLGDDRNLDIQDLYFEVVGDLRTEIAAIQGADPQVTFDEVLKQIFNSAFAAFASGARVNREALRALVAFMYFECDIGRKEC